MDWRDTTPGHVQVDLDRLFEDALNIVERAYASGSVAPFMLALGVEGDKGMRQYGATGTTLKNEADLLRMLEAPGDRAGLRARCTAYEVTLAERDGESSDALKVALEHRDGTCLDLLIPVAFDGGSVSIEMERALVDLGEPRLWRPQSSLSDGSD